jgi:hypothetical protein
MTGDPAVQRVDEAIVNERDLRTLFHPIPQCVYDDINVNLNKNSMAKDPTFV